MEKEIIVSVYYMEDDNGKKILDEDSIREEFETRLSELQFEEEKEN